MNVPLRAPFVISSARLDAVHNVSVRIDLADGSTGWGEIPLLPPVTPEDQPAALEAVQRVAPQLCGRLITRWRPLTQELLEALPHMPTVRAGLEMAMWDALAKSWGVSLSRLFGGSSDSLVTDITIPICSPEEARSLAASYRSQGFKKIKTKIGFNIPQDIARLAAIRDAHRDCEFILDANGGYTADEALKVLRELRSLGMSPSLLEQPVPRSDWEGLGRVTREGGVRVAADESCRTVKDALYITGKKLAHVLNVKLVKCGVAGGLDIVAIARAAGLELMIGGMVETRIAIGFSAHFAAGLGGFQWIDLDTPLLMAEDPVQGGYRTNGACYDLSHIETGHGGTL